ncbi:MAG: methionine adenosyltransferase [bacterium]
MPDQEILISIQVEDRIPTKSQPIEIVERKGKGHPDSLCDALVENASLALNQLYLEYTGHILHYNLDKGLLAAGQASPDFGGGEVRIPMKMIFGDRATFQYLEKEIPVWDTVVHAARQWIAHTFRSLDPNRHIIFQNEMRPGSAELISTFTHFNQVLKANDTSAAVGFAPPTPTERLVISLDQYLQSSSFQEQFPAAGQDIKIMAVRKEHSLDLTISLAMIAQFVTSEKSYFEQKEFICNKLVQFIQPQIDTSVLDLRLNTLDQPGKGIDGVYLTVTGTAAEQGDSGQVGRGNRSNGLICLHRPQSSEAAPGKNPVSHVGKIYNHLAFLLAEDIYHELEEAAEVSVWLTSRIGEPVNHPSLIAVELIPEKGKPLAEGYREGIRSLVNQHLEMLPEFCNRLISGEISSLSP